MRVTHSSLALTYKRGDYFFYIYLNAQFMPKLTKSVNY